MILIWISQLENCDKFAPMRPWNPSSMSHLSMTHRRDAEADINLVSLIPRQDTPAGYSCCVTGRLPAGTSPRWRLDSENMLTAFVASQMDAYSSDILYSIVRLEMYDISMIKISRYFGGFVSKAWRNVEVAVSRSKDEHKYYPTPQLLSSYILSERVFRYYVLYCIVTHFVSFTYLLIYLLSLLVTWYLARRQEQSRCELAAHIVNSATSSPGTLVSINQSTISFVDCCHNRCDH